jgi:ElaB/YqjD/DUF883 family membrane-anchored ribosome-binding protein
MSPADKGSTQTPDQQGSRDPEKIRAEIKETRGELGDTVAAVAEKTDVKEQAHQKADELKSQAGEKAEEARAKVKEVGEKAKEAAPESATEGVQQAQRLAQENPMPVAIGAAFTAGVVIGRLLWR